MLVTIIADASYCHETHAAGYGFWIACIRGKQGGSGGVRNPVVNNIAAEMIALVNGLHQACKWGLVQPADRVLLQTDCLAAISAFKSMRKSITPEELELVDYMNRMCSTMCIEVEYRHVKGHTDGSSPRFYINNKCDDLARKAMRKVRGLFRHKAHNERQQKEKK